MAQRRLVEIVLDGKDNTKGAFDSLGLNLDSNKGKVLAFAGAAAGIGAAFSAATKQLYDFTAQMAATGDRADKLSARLDMTVESLSEIEFVAKRAGVPVNTMTMALQRMVRRVSEAAEGTGEAKDAIRELGVEAGLLSELSPDEQFYQIARALQDVESQSDRVRLAFKLFDSEGVSVLQTMRGDLEEVRKEFEKFGGAMSSGFSEASASFTDAQTKLATATDRLKEAFAEPFLQPFTNSINTLAEAVAELQKMEIGTPVPFATTTGPLSSLGWAAFAMGMPPGQDPYADSQPMFDPSRPLQGAAGPYRSGFMGPSGPYNPMTAPTPAIDPRFATQLLNESLGFEYGGGGPLDLTAPAGSLMQGWDSSLFEPMDPSEVNMDWFVGLEQGLKDAEDSANAFSDSFQTAIGSALNNGLMEAENFGEAFTSLMRAVFQQVIAQSEMNPIAGGFIGGILGLAGGVMGKSYVASAETKGMPGPLVLAGAGAAQSAAQAAYGKVYV